MVGYLNVILTSWILFFFFRIVDSGSFWDFTDPIPFPTQSGTVTDLLPNSNYELRVRTQTEVGIGRRRRRQTEEDCTGCTYSVTVNYLTCEEGKEGLNCENGRKDMILVFLHHCMTHKVRDNNQPPMANSQARNTQPGQLPSRQFFPNVSHPGQCHILRWGKLSEW